MGIGYYLNIYVVRIIGVIMASPPNKIVTEELESEIISRYLSGDPARKIRDDLGVFKTHKTVYDILKKHGITTRDWGDYSDTGLDHLYFTNIDTPNKAYVLGLMIADGWVYSPKNSIGIGLTDLDAIDFVRREWKTNNKPIDIHPRLKANNESLRKNAQQIVVTSNTMRLALKKYGVVDRKSLVTFLPILEEFQSHMIRGVLDGDGTIGQYLTGRTIKFYGSHWLIAQLSLFLHLELGITYQLPSLHDSISVVAWSSSREVDKLGEYIYSDAEQSFYLERKRQCLQKSSL